VVVLHDPVQHRVGHGGVPDPFMPVLYGQLASNDRGLSSRPVINHLQQVRSRLRIHPHQAPVIEHQHVRVLQYVQPACERAIGVPDSKFFGQTRHPLVEGAMPLAAGVLSQCTAQPRLARSGRTGDQHRMPTAYPGPQRQAHHRGAVNPPGGPAVQVFDHGLRVFEAGGFEQLGAAPVLPAVHLSVYQHGQTLFKAHGADAALLHLLLQRLGHAHQLELAQLIQLQSSRP